ncbi:MAG: hypothetical protein MI700_11710 [Balneolales bacterium]|nr:hypothetical protein [Balneolales bacterium]
MRILFRSFILFVVVFNSGSLVGQETNSFNATINISTQVVQSIDLITVNTISFENAQPGDGELYINPITNGSAGYMIALGTPGAEFRLDYNQQKTLFRIEGNGTLMFEYEISANDVDDQESSELLDFTSRNLNFNAEGRFYFWVGGKVNLENAQPGNYEGDFTIEIEYI